MVSRILKLTLQNFKPKTFTQFLCCNNTVTKFKHIKEFNILICNEYFRKLICILPVSQSASQLVCLL